MNLNQQAKGHFTQGTFAYSFNKNTTAKTTSLANINVKHY